MNRVFQRSMAEVAESTSYGKLYRISRKVGNKFLAVRYRRDSKKGILYADKSERITIERTEHSEREIVVGDFAFQSTDGIWSHWALRDKPADEKEAL